jgi:hypothetical protein
MLDLQYERGVYLEEMERSVSWKGNAGALPDSCLSRSFFRA